MQTAYQQEPGEPIGITKYAHQINDDFVDLKLKLKDVGLPPLQKLTVETSEVILLEHLISYENFINFQ